MRPLFLASLILVAGISYLGLFLTAHATPASWERAVPTNTRTPTRADANRLLQRQPGLFVPNLGQWEHAAKFVHRSGPMTVFVKDRGWVLDLVERPARPKTNPHEAHRAMPSARDVQQKIRGVALSMTFEGELYVPEIVGEQTLPGHHNYFLGNDESRWRTHVPLYASVRYENLYPGIDLRLREMNGVPEYDLLLQPGADLSRVVVQVEGGRGLSITGDGSLVIETALGPVTQTVPKTWEVRGDGRKREVVCHFVLRGADRFGFEAPGWDGATSLTIDPALIWSTFLGGSAWDSLQGLSVDASGVVTVTGDTSSPKFPTTIGSYNRTYNGRGSTLGGDNGFVSRLDPSKTGSAQLIYSTFLNDAVPLALFVDTNGVVTLGGYAWSTSFPTTRGAYDTTFNGGWDAFVSRLDPSKIGSAQLVYSTFLGGSSLDYANSLSADANRVVTVAGNTSSSNFPTTSGAYDSTYNGGSHDVFVSRLDPRKTGSAQLFYSTLLGGSRDDSIGGLCVDARGVVTVAGGTSSPNLPTTSGAYDTTHNGSFDAFVSRLDPRKTGSAQLVYSTLLGGSGSDGAHALAVDASGVVTVAGATSSPNLPTTSGSYDTTYNGDTWFTFGDAFVSRLDPSKTGSAQLAYSTFLGGNRGDFASALSVDVSGVVTVAGNTSSSNFPTTSGAYDTTHNLSDAFVSRLDPTKSGITQLVYSTFLGGTGGAWPGDCLSADASGVVTVGGWTSGAFPTTRGAYDTSYNGGAWDVFVSRLSMGMALYGDAYEISITTGGTQKLAVNAGKAHANKLYWIFGSETGTRPGVDLLGVHIPLNPDLYTIIAMGAVNGKEFTNFKGTLNANGLATASFVVPANLPLPPGFTFHHAYVVYDASGKVFMASNAVPVRLK